MEKEFYASLTLRIGLAFGFIYVAIFSFVKPLNWIGFLPDFVEVFLPKETALIVFSIFEILLGLLLLFDHKIFIVSIISSVTLFFITIFNFGALDIVFRDVSIFFASLALSFLSYDKRKLKW